jgi:geranylgeranyl diphosphate synthase, type II
MSTLQTALHPRLLSQNNFKRMYANYLSQIDAYLHDLMQATNEPRSLYEPFKYIMNSEGKRIRPVLTMMACAAVGGNPSEVVHAGASIEILHNFTLVHDDIMDRSPLRRNNPTVHVRWNDATAILAGDVMMGFAYRHLIINTPHEHLADVLEAYTQGFIDVCEGQAYDLDFRDMDSITLDDYFMMIEKKTARLLEMSVAVGAIIGGATKAQVESLKHYARCLGIAFQIQDDLLDLTADVADLGKTIGQDIIEGKKTYLILKAMELATNPEYVALLNEFFRLRGLPADKVDAVRTMMDEIGVLSLAQETIDSYFSEAQQSLLALPDSEAREHLQEVIVMLNKRKK